VSKFYLSALLLFTLICTAHTASAWNLWGESEPLLTVNDQTYQCQDYQDWWREWRETDQPPTSLDDYINWLLLSNEAAQMQLQDQPGYQKKIATFLKVRSMMLLKKEEIDDNVVVPNEETLHKFYLENFIPHWQLRTVTFRTREELDKFMDEYAGSPDSSTEDILASLSLTENDYLLSSAVWDRPYHLPEKITALLRAVDNQRFSEPYPWRKTWQVIEVLAAEAASDEDFKELRSSLEQLQLKQQRTNLTAQLIEQLREQYPVESDETLLESIQYNGVPEEQAQQIVLKFLSYQITAAELHNAAKQQYDSLAPQQKMKVPFSQTRQQVLEAIVSQNLVDTEALERHYEQRPPLKSTFDFYRNHRLIKELEQQIILPEVQNVTDEAIKEAYEKHKVELSGPPLVEIIRGQTTDPDLAARLHSKLREGEDFAAIMAVLGNSHSKPEKLPLQHLIEPVQEKLKSMSPGQAVMVEDGTNYIFIRLIKAPKQEIVAFDKVKQSLKDELKRGAFLQKKQDVIQQLRKRSTIEINQKQWQSCLETLQKGS